MEHVEEQWRPIPQFPEYRISSHGRVMSHKWGRSFILKPEVHYIGYLRVMLCRRPVKRFRIHRLVAEAFIPNPAGLPVVNHKDRNKKNNQVSNLEWVTQRDNVRHWQEDNRQRVAHAVSTPAEYIFTDDDIPW